MQFQLPSNLQTELLAYDPTLKKLAQESKPKTKSTKPKYPLGNINNLIPTHIVRESLQQQAVDHINSVNAPDRYQLFTKVIDQEVTPIAIIYHYEQCWHAAWLPPKGQENEYIYGYAFAFKDTVAAAKVIPHRIWEHRADYECQTVGRSQIYRYSRLINKYDIRVGQDARFWRSAGIANYYQKSRDISNALNRFEDQLRKTIPTWSDSMGIFDRIKCTSMVEAMELRCTNYLQTVDNQEWQPSVDNFFSIVDYYFTRDGYEGCEYKDAQRIRHILNTPFFRRWIQLRCNECIAEYNDPNNKERKRIRAPWKQIMHLCYTINTVHSIWPEAPVDYYQNHLESLLNVRLRLNASQEAIQWLNDNMQVSSFFNILDKHYNKMLAELDENSYRHSFAYDSDLQCYQFSFHEWHDTISMISRVLDAGVAIAAPKRWRIEEFHDHIQAEAWKVKNPNEGLPQDLFPQPVRITLDNQSWSFFQPVDTHQLALWGQAVRNCVGSASHYADDCKKKKHFIVLCMLDGKPQFTIQLIVNNGMMSVKQIAGIANQRLTDDQKEQYTAAFRLALQERESALKS